MSKVWSLCVWMPQYSYWWRTRLWQCRSSIFTNDDVKLLSYQIRGRSRIFKLVKGKNGTTSFFPSKEKTGEKLNYIQNKVAMCLTEKQADHVYKAIEEGNMINTRTIICETAQIQDDNPYKKVVLNKVSKEEDKSPEMRYWSIFSDNVRYIQHDQVTPQNLNIDSYILNWKERKERH